MDGWINQWMKEDLQCLLLWSEEVSLIPLSTSKWNPCPSLSCFFFSSNDLFLSLMFRLHALQKSNSTNDISKVFLYSPFLFFIKCSWCLPGPVSEKVEMTLLDCQVTDLSEQCGSQPRFRTTFKKLFFHLGIHPKKFCFNYYLVDPKRARTTALSRVQACNLHQVLFGCTCSWNFKYFNRKKYLIPQKRENMQIASAEELDWPKDSSG